MEESVKASFDQFPPQHMLSLVLLAAFAFPVIATGRISFGQSTAKQSKASADCFFDVASIRQSRGDQQTRVREEGAGTIFRATSLSPVWLLYNAFQVKDHQQVSGYPKWVESDLYDILAKTPEDEAASHCLDDDDREAAVLRELLVQRFALKYHVEKKQIQVYALKVAKNGPKLKVSKLEPEDIAKNPDGQYWFSPPATIRLQYATADKLAGILTTVVGGRVYNRTGLDQHYDLELKWDRWTPPANQVVQTIEPSAEELSNGTPISHALQEQLGLRLVPEKTLLPVYIIDHIERPTPN
jgi:uncharacterized protein (TIGR03435 family)